MMQVGWLFMSVSICLLGHFFLSEGIFFSKKPRDCIITPWANWGTCTKSSSTYRQTRSRFTSPPRDGGKPCPRRLSLRQSRECSGPSEATSARLFKASFTNALRSSSSSSNSFRFRVTSSSGVRQTFQTLSLARPSVSIARPVLPRTTRERTSSGQYCDVLRNSAGQLISSGNCGPSRNGRKKRSVLMDMYQTTSFSSTLNRFRRQTLEQSRDVLILMDKSASIGNNMRTVKDMAAAVVHTLCQGSAIELGLSKTRIAVASFDTSYRVHINFNQFSGRTGSGQFQLETAIKSLRIESSGLTHMVKAMTEARTKTFRDARIGARHSDRNVGKLIVVITDGCANGPGDLKKVSEQYVKEGISIIAVYVGRNEGNCFNKIMDLNTNRRCFQQFYLVSWRQAQDEFIRQLYDENCDASAWADLLNSCQ